MKSGTVTTKLGAALTKWSHIGFNLGITKIDDILDVWEKIKGRPENQRENDYVVQGFKK